METKREIFIRKNNLIDSPFFKTFAKNYLHYLGNSNPTPKQLTEMQVLLSSTWIRQPICFDLRLTEREKRCLHLSAQGKTLKEIAAFLKVSAERVTQYRKSICQKLNCKNIASAIIIALRWGELRPEHFTEPTEPTEPDPHKF